MITGLQLQGYRYRMQCPLQILSNGHTLKSRQKKLWPAITAENDEEPLQVQTLTANTVGNENGIGQNRFELTELIDIQELLESYFEDLNKTELKEILNSQPVEDEGTIGTGKVTFNFKNFTEVLRMVKRAVISL